MDYSFVILKVLAELEPIRHSHIIYSKYHHLFTEYLLNRPTSDDGHFVECMYADGDVVDTCKCHFYTKVKPCELLKDYLYDTFMLRLCHEDSV